MGDERARSVQFTSWDRAVIETTCRLLIIIFLAAVCMCALLSLKQELSELELRELKSSEVSVSVSVSEFVPFPCPAFVGDHLNDPHFHGVVIT